MSIGIINSKGWRTVLGGFLIHLILGTLYLWANITIYVTSYLRKYNNKIEYHDSIIVYAMGIATDSIFMFSSGLIQNKYGTRVCVLTGGLIISLSIFLSSFATSLLELTLSNGLLFGFGIGICYSAPISSSIQWLPNNKSLVCGIIVSGFGGGSFIFGIIAILLVNPNNEQINESTGYYDIDSDVVNNVPYMYRMLSIIYVVVIIISSFLINDLSDEVIDITIDRSIHSSIDHIEFTDLSDESSNKSFDKSNDNYVDIYVDKSAANQSYNILHNQSNHNIDINSNHFNHLKQDSNEELITDQSPIDLLTNPLAYHTLLCFILTAVSGLYIAGTYKVLVENILHNDRTLSIIGSISAIFSAIGRIVWGYIADNIGIINTLLIMSIVLTIILFIYPFVLTYLSIYSIITCGIFFCEGANFSLYLPLVNILFGSKYVNTNFGLMFAVVGTLTVVNILFLSNISMNNYLLCDVLSLITFLGFISLLLLDKHIKYYNKIYT